MNTLLEIRGIQFAEVSFIGRTLCWRYVESGFAKFVVMEERSLFVESF